MSCICCQTVISHISGLGSPYSSGKPKVRSDSGAAAFIATDDSVTGVVCFIPLGSFTVQCKAQLWWHGCTYSKSVSTVLRTYQHGQYRHSWRGGGRQSPLSALGVGCVCQLMQGKQVVIKTVKKLKKIGKSWVLLQKYSLREAIPFLVLTVKASRKQSRMIFSQWYLWIFCF